MGAEAKGVFGIARATWNNDKEVNVELILSVTCLDCERMKVHNGRLVCDIFLKDHSVLIELLQNFGLCECFEKRKEYADGKGRTC